MAKFICKLEKGSFSHYAFRDEGSSILLAHPKCILCPEDKEPDTFLDDLKPGTELELDLDTDCGDCPYIFLDRKDVAILAEKVLTIKEKAKMCHSHAN